MVIILASEDVNVHRRARCDGERVKNMWQHLCREVADFFALHAEVGEAVWPRADVDNSAR